MVTHDVVSVLNGITGVKPITDRGDHVDVVIGCRLHGHAARCLADFSLLDQDFSGFDDVAGQFKHQFPVGVGGIDGDIRVGSRSQVPFSGQSQHPGGGRTGNDRDFGEGIFPRELTEDGDFANAGGKSP